MFNYTGSNTKSVNEKADSRQVRNTDGRGFVFSTTDENQLRRFLILGAVNQFYANEREIVKDNASVVERLIAGGKSSLVLQHIVEVSDAGLAASNDYALFALALVLVKGDTKAAGEVINKVARIGTHKVHLAKFIKNMGGWKKKGVRDAMARAYTSLSADDLMFDAMKYQSRDGWSQGDVLRLAHPRAVNAEMNAAFYFMVYGFNDPEEKNEFGRARRNAFANAVGPAIDRLYAFEELRATKDIPTAVRLIQQWGLPRECVPTELLNNAEIWNALLPTMGLGAMTRNLATMTRAGVLQEKAALNLVLNAITDREKVRKNRLHPLNILLALRTYNEGHGLRGDNTWTPIKSIVDALNETFYMAFDVIEGTGKAIRLCLDVSGSMSSPIMKPDPSGKSYGIQMPISSCDLTACIAMVLARKESNYEVVGFANRLTDLHITPSMRLDEAIRHVQLHNFGSTNIGLAYDTHKKFDAFVVITDGEVNTGDHPYQVVNAYRQKHGPAKQIVMATTATNFTIAPPDDLNSLDIVGFSADAPTLITNFIKGTV